MVRAGKVAGTKFAYGIRDAGISVAEISKKVGVGIAEDAGFIRRNYPQAPLTWVQMKRKLLPLKHRM